MTRNPETIDFWVGRLPHWEVVDGRYFVTIHLSGAIPEAGHHRIHDRPGGTWTGVLRSNPNARFYVNSPN